ncbi:MAG: endonuclease domain-containing protein [Tepidisphaerales bacterium]
MQERRDYDRRLLSFARQMRRQPTDAEKKLWSVLRGQRLGGLKFRRQHPVAGYILDFYCEEHSVAVELDGGQHTTEEGRAYDQRRSEKLAELGIRVLRFSDIDVLKHTDAVARTILRELGIPHG